MGNTTIARSLPRLLVVALACTAAMAQSADFNNTPVPPEIKVPDGHVAFMKTTATGTQNYICLPSGWTFLAPQAALFLNYRWFNIEVRQQAATHFLSVNPKEVDMARPTWQSSLDTSAIWAKAVASSSDPGHVAKGAIPWLLLEVVGARRGPTGGASLVPATYLQRINTTGGIKPTTACTVGELEMVPYTADYIFYRASN